MSLRRGAESAWPSASKFTIAFGLGLRLGDLAILAGTAALAYRLRFGNADLPLEYLRAIAHTLVFALLILNGSSLYRSWRGRGLVAEILKLTAQWALLFVVLLVYAAALKLTGDISRIWALSWFGLSLCAAVALRVGVRSAAHWVRERGLDLRSAVIVGANPDAQRILDTLRRSHWAGIRVRGWFATHADRGQLTGVPMLGGLENLGGYVESSHIDQVWLALPMHEQAKISFALAQLEHSTADVKYLPDLFGMRLLNHSVDSFLGLPVINLRSSPLDGEARVVKAAEDKLLASLILLLISPLLTTIAVAVKLSSPGPVLFRQLRHGRDGKPIEVWKFRSMRVHQEHDGQVTQATRDDPRVTPLGAFLRRTSLDELPQFFNVLQGTMSIVGPRPHAIAHNEHYKTLVDHYMQRHRVKPGITGWAQVNGLRGETDTLEKMAKRVRYDLFYLQNWSLALDLKIIAMTVLKGFFGKNAY
ncbi:undecaprenyl-phosphate glucose phosphotransferase [Luteimonas suaedae]|uniref:undecaprenyl-phosphate glucose phosphotransferase n=1 Tax=Luteimonas suaedae TaxID=2605430 RepID=UPI0011EFC4BA|nr:undecaprenyl-phosphate glucose phosphotransferase [Luteimonas suaedae]